MRESIARKQQEVDELASKLAAAKTIVAFEYHGLTVDSFTNLREQLRKANCDVKVYKNNISRRASEKAGFSEFASHLTGPLAIITSDVDTIMPAKIINDFAKTNKKVAITVGVIEGKFAETSKVIELANTPSEDVLLTMLAMGMLAPVRDLTIGLHMLCEKLEQPQQ